MSSLLVPFKAYVDQSLIRNASNFFDNSTVSILRELLQNSRRSGATRVDLRQKDKRWIYSDNGPGCSPQDLLGLGASRWQEGVLEKETPAGCGFFSLARRNPSVTCPRRNWRVDLAEPHFNGELEIKPVPAFSDAELVDADTSLGLVIEFDFVTGCSSYGLTAIAKYMPLDFYLNGSLQACRADFMGAPSDSLAHRIIEVSEFVTLRVDLVRGVSGINAANYHGWKVDLPARDYLTFGTTNGGNVAVRSALEVVREKALPLELPQRNKMVASATTKAIQDLIYCTALELAASTLQETSVASPQLWLLARSRGYTGPVLYPKFIGRLLTRRDNTDMSDYLVCDDEDGEVWEEGRYVTLEDFEDEAQGYKIAPSAEVLTLIAQTTIPCEENDGHSIFAIDTDEFFAPDLRLVKRLKSLEDFGYRIDETSEAYSWARRLRDAVNKRSSWCEQVLVVAHGTSADGKKIAFEEDVECRSWLDSEKLYDSISLDFLNETGGTEVSLPAAALFKIPGDKDDMDIDFILTKQWLERMPSDFKHTLTSAVFTIRKCQEEEDVSYEQMCDQFEQKLAKFSGLEAFYKERFLAAAIAGVSEGLYQLDATLDRVVLTLPLNSNSRSVASGLASCEFVKPYAAFYFFVGAHGTTSCDEAGNRPPYEECPSYPEYHSFDVASMKQLGIEPGEVDILDACGWHDSTKRIYVMPSLPHLLWTAGCLSQEPSEDVMSDAVRVGLTNAIKGGRVSPDLYSAIWYAHTPLVKAIVPAAMSYLPPIRQLWIYAPFYP